MFQGQRINNTEHRAVLHTALRRPTDQPLNLDGDNIMVAISNCAQQKMDSLVNAIHSGQWRGYSQQAITDVVNIGIGGSDLGPRMVVNALALITNRTLLVTLSPTLTAQILPQH